MQTEVSEFPGSEALAVGDTVIVLLRQDGEPNVFRFTRGPFGVFRVNDAGVRALFSRG